MKFFWSTFVARSSLFFLPCQSTLEGAFVQKLWMLAREVWLSNAEDILKYSRRKNALELMFLTFKVILIFFISSQRWLNLVHLPSIHRRERYCPRGCRLRLGWFSSPVFSAKKGVEFWISNRVRWACSAEVHIIWSALSLLRLSPNQLKAVWWAYGSKRNA